MLQRKVYLSVGLAMTLVTALFAQGGKTPAISEIMQKAHQSKTGLRAKIGDEVDKSSPDWTEIQRLSKEFVELTAALEKNKPPRGDAAQWQKLAKQYADSVKNLDQLVAKKDAKEVKAATQKLAANCKGCHDEHRPKAR